MIGIGDCQKSGSMRSKSVIAPSVGGEKTAVGAIGPRALHAPGSLALVKGGDTRTTNVIKPGLY